MCDTLIYVSRICSCYYFSIIYVSSCCIYVQLRLYVCPPTTVTPIHSASPSQPHICMYMCPTTTTCRIYVYICVLLLLHVAYMYIYVSSYYYMCPPPTIYIYILLLYMCPPPAIHHCNTYTPTWPHLHSYGTLPLLSPPPPPPLRS
jgi:hypothetical protein